MAVHCHWLGQKLIATIPNTSVFHMIMDTDTVLVCLQGTLPTYSIRHSDTDTHHYLSDDTPGKVSQDQYRKQRL